MNIFTEMAEALLQMSDYTFFESKLNGRFGFDYKKDYSGLMAQPPKVGRDKGKVKRAKQGLFDIVIVAGRRFENVTHRALFEDLIRNSDIDICLEVWRGRDPRIIGVTMDEKESLATMALLMFEQEVNWGKNSWQRGTNFTPFVRQPSRRRPRDMLMGFIRQAFHLGINHLDEMKYWMKTRPGTIWFIDKDESPWGYSSYPSEFKRFFTELEQMGGIEAVTVGEIRSRFQELADNTPDNPWFVG